MRQLLAKVIQKIKLLYLWIRRILFAPDHFNTPIFRRLWLAFHGYIPDQYYIYDFAHNDYKEYLSEFDWYKSRFLNGKDAYVLNNKIICAQLVSRYAKIPQTYFFKKNSKKIVFMDGTLATDDNILDFIKNKEKVIYKPTDIGKGKHIHIIEWNNDNKQYLIDFNVVDALEILKLFHNSKLWFCSELIEQSQFLNDIFPASTNTMRIITARESETNTFKTVFAVLRIGRNSSIPVDNASQGGLISKINLETGEISESKSLHNVEVYENHPDTHKKIKGLVIPNWKEIQNSVLNVSNQFPYLDFIAWDILHTNDGYCVIEANASSGVNIVQIWGGQRNGELGKVYKNYGIIK